ncbi:serine/threonine protein phosphatase [Sphingomonas oligophenolica]|uniref:Serine/threonine protein phosphatase n=2 Tax=Sphingomonas oligophenolica TaxID=301154 RepID=A0A502C8N4_9SPHN|nr:metallophosphoesterase family protein [Sphingomonas oligophenolica]TPG08121.1 serine/threonine protein phosphatase [Sphingomonas oligophenolica]
MPLKSFFRNPKTRPLGSVPAGSRVYAVGDIHGRLDCLEAMLALIVEDRAHRDPADTTLIFLGDFVDRGPDSCGVVERVRTLDIPGVDIRALKGNHEEILLSAAENDRSSLGLFDRVGGKQTMLSYGMTEDEYDHVALSELAALMQHHIPPAHMKYLAGLGDHISIGDYRFVHAGIRPGIAFDEQRGSDLRWIRREFLDHSGSHDGIIVHGHTITEEPVDLPHRVGIDTGAFVSGRLTTLVLEGSERRFLSTCPSAITPASADLK